MFYTENFISGLQKTGLQVPWLIFLNGIGQISWSGIHWFGVDDTYYTVYSHMYFGITKVPEKFAEGNGDMITFSENPAFWIFNQVSNFACTCTRLLIGNLQKNKKKWK